MNVIDVNAAFGFWPLQAFPYRTLAELDQVYERNEIAEVWLSAVESILFPDPDFYDFPLFDQLKAFPRFRPVKTVNPLLANWRRSCERALQEHAVRALKIYPNYHDYPLNHREVTKFCDFAAENSLPVLVTLRVNDERNQPTCLQVLPTDIDATASLIRQHPRTSFVVLCPYLNELQPLASVDNVMADISFLDFEDPLVFVRDFYPVSKLVFGSHAPFLYPESSALKIGYSQLPDADNWKVASENIERLSKQP